MNLTGAKRFEAISDKWKVVEQLGSGSSGTVYKIERKDYPNMKSALKIISIPSSQCEVRSFREDNYDLDDKSVTSYFYGFVEEFIKEIQIMSQLRGHSNIVSYEDHDVKKHDDEIGWDILIRMELLTPMNEYFKNHDPSCKDVIKLGIDICKALEICQKYKIIHRDIKPSNIFISDNGDFKLGDFGVARTLEKTSSGLSKKGTYTYMAPEVFKGEEYGSNVDMYSLGIVMYRLLNNNLEPFRKDRTFSDSENAMAMRMKGHVIPKPVNADKSLTEIVLKACAFNPENRYKTPLQMRTALESILCCSNENGDMHLYEDEELADNDMIIDREQKTMSIFSSTMQEKEQGTVSIFSENDFNRIESDNAMSIEAEQETYSDSHTKQANQVNAKYALVQTVMNKTPIILMISAIINLICILFLPIFLDINLKEFISGTLFFRELDFIFREPKLMVGDFAFVSIICIVDLLSLVISAGFLKNKIPIKTYNKINMWVAIVMVISFFKFILVNIFANGYIWIPLCYIRRSTFENGPWLTSRCSILLFTATILLFLVCSSIFAVKSKND